MCTPHLLCVRVDCKDMYVYTYFTSRFNVHSMHIYIVYLHKLCSSAMLSIVGHVMCLVTVDTMPKLHSVHCHSPCHIHCHSSCHIHCHSPCHILNLTPVNKAALLTAAEAGSGSNVLIPFVQSNGCLHVQSSVELFELFHKFSSFFCLVVQCHSLCTYIHIINMPHAHHTDTRAKTAT